MMMTMMPWCLTTSCCRRTGLRTGTRSRHPSGWLVCWVSTHLLGGWWVRWGGAAHRRRPGASSRDRSRGELQQQPMTRAALAPAPVLPARCVCSPVEVVEGSWAVVGLHVPVRGCCLRHPPCPMEHHDHGHDAHVLSVRVLSAACRPCFAIAPQAGHSRRWRRRHPQGGGGGWTRAGGGAGGMTHMAVCQHCTARQALCGARMRVPRGAHVGGGWCSSSSWFFLKRLDAAARSCNGSRAGGRCPWVADRVRLLVLGQAQPQLGCTALTLVALEVVVWARPTPRPDARTGPGAWASCARVPPGPTCVLAPAVVAFGAGRQSPLCERVAHEHADVVLHLGPLQVSDEGGGIPRSGMPNIWTYLYSTAKRWGRRGERYATHRTGPVAADEGRREGRGPDGLGPPEDGRRAIGVHAPLDGTLVLQGVCGALNG